MDDYYNGDFQNDNNQMGQMNEQQAPVYTYIPTEPGTPRKPKKTKKNGGFWKKAGMFVLCGALVGGAGAGSFIGVMKVSGYEAKLEKAGSGRPRKARQPRYRRQRLQQQEAQAPPHQERQR